MPSCLPTSTVVAERGESCRGGSSGTFIMDRLAEEAAVGLSMGVGVVGDLLGLADGLAEGVAVGFTEEVDVAGNLLGFAGGLAEGVAVGLSVGEDTVGDLLGLADRSGSGYRG